MAKKKNSVNKKERAHQIIEMLFDTMKEFYSEEDKDNDVFNLRLPLPVEFRNADFSRFIIKQQGEFVFWAGKTQIFLYENYDYFHLFRHKRKIDGDFGGMRVEFAKQYKDRWDGTVGDDVIDFSVKHHFMLDGLVEIATALLAFIMSYDIAQHEKRGDWGVDCFKGFGEGFNGYISAKQPLYKRVMFWEGDDVLQFLMMALDRMEGKAAKRVINKILRDESCRSFRELYEDGGGISVQDIARLIIKHDLHSLEPFIRWNTLPKWEPQTRKTNRILNGGFFEALKNVSTKIKHCANYLEEVKK